MLSPVNRCNCLACNNSVNSEISLYSRTAYIYNNRVSILFYCYAR